MKGITDQSEAFIQCTKTWKSISIQLKINSRNSLHILNIATAPRTRLILLLILCVLLLDVAYAPLPYYTPAGGKVHGGRDALIKGYFRQGFKYKDIAFFLTTLHGISIGVNYLKHLVRKLKLRRRVELTDVRLQEILEVVDKETKTSGKKYVMINHFF